jgi:hypothetical protein
MKILLATALVALVVLVGAAGASAANVEAPDLEAKIHTTVRVTCSTDWADDPYGGVRDASGYALLSENAVVLSPDVCAILRGPLLVNQQWAAAAEVLLHELSHVAWQNTNEADAECFALFIFRAEMRHAWGLSEGRAQLMYDYAWRVHLSEPPQYQGCAVYMPRDPLAAY